MKNDSQVEFPKYVVRLEQYMLRCVKNDPQVDLVYFCAPGTIHV